VSSLGDCSRVTPLSGSRRYTILHPLKDIEMVLKHILRYLKCANDMWLFYSKKFGSSLVGYADAGYLSDPHKSKSQMRYVFARGETTIFWRSVKQTLTSSNHYEIIAIHEVSWEYAWFRNMTHHIQVSCELASMKNNPTILCEDNAVCIIQLKWNYIKGDITKYISPKFFYTHEV